MVSKSKSSIAFIYKRFKHHADHSGYDRIVKYITGELISAVSSPNQEQLFEKYISSVNNSVCYNSAAYSLEVEAIARMLGKENQIYHVLYAEHMYQFLGYFSGLRNNRVVCTFHEPPNILHRLFKSKESLRKMNGAIALSKDLADYLGEIIGHHKVFFVPHGIDTDFFRPIRTGVSEKKTCIVVGEHLRDFEMLHQVIRKVNCEAEIGFRLIIPKAYHHIFKGLKNIDIQSKVPEEILLDCYCSSDLLLLPLKDCAANNTLLEGMACGLPIIATSVGGIKDYVNEECAILVHKGDVPTMADAVLMLLKDDMTAHSMGVASREKAIQFSWEKIAEQTKKVYQAIH